MSFFIKAITYISLILYAFTSSSYADWVKYLSNEIGDDFYISPKSIETKGKFVVNRLVALCEPTLVLSEPTSLYIYSVPLVCSALEQNEKAL